MSITYRELKDQLASLTKAELNQTATIFVPDEGSGEYYSVHDRLTITCEDNDVLDVGHIVLTIA